MKSGPNDGWHSIMPLCFRGKAEAYFCMFPKVKATYYIKGNTSPQESLSPPEKRLHRASEGSVRNIGIFCDVFAQHRKKNLAKRVRFLSFRAD
ncbi:hypothetical protein ACFX2A_005254 [Malus domestica]